MLSVSKISKKTFTKRLLGRKNENAKVLNQIEKFFIKKRGYVSRIPPAKTPVILLVSGGIDSIATWWLLMEKYKLNIYPLFLARGITRRKKERSAVNFYSKYFSKHYPGLYHEPQEYSTSLPPFQLERMVSQKNKYFHPQRILDQLDVKNKTSTVYSLDIVSAYLYYFYGLLYAKQIFQNKNIKIRTVFTGVNPQDGEYILSQTQTAIRSAQLSFCLITNDYKWQCMSLLFDSATGNWIEKSELIKLASEHKFPLEYTWTCANSKIFQCGECFLCKIRKDEFAKAGVNDATLYLSDTKKHLARGIAKLIIKNLIHT